MHLFDAKVNFSCSGIVGEGMAPAVGRRDQCEDAQDATMWPCPSSARAQPIRAFFTNR